MLDQEVGIGVERSRRGRKIWGVRGGEVIGGYGSEDLEGIRVGNRGQLYTIIAFLDAINPPLPFFSSHSLSSFHVPFVTPSPSFTPTLIHQILHTLFFSSILSTPLRLISFLSCSPQLPYITLIITPTLQIQTSNTDA